VEDFDFTTHCENCCHSSRLYTEEFKEATMNDKTDHTSNKNDSVLTIPEVANRIKISKSKIYSLASAEKIPHIRFGCNVRIME